MYYPPPPPPPPIITHQREEEQQRQQQVQVQVEEGQQQQQQEQQRDIVPKSNLQGRSLSLAEIDGAQQMQLKSVKKKKQKKATVIWLDRISAAQRHFISCALPFIIKLKLKEQRTYCSACQTKSTEPYHVFGNAPLIFTK